MKVFFSTVLLSIVVVLANRLFYLTPWAYIPYVFDTADVGLVLMWGALLATMMRNRTNALYNPISLLVLLYILLIGVQIALSALYYDQSLLDGLIAARQQFSYASFFLFLLLLDDTRKIKQLLNFLSVIALCAFILALINYMGPQIIHNSIEDDMRAGIRRIYIPGFALLTLTCIWQISRWISKERPARFAAVLSLIFLGAIFFNLRRGTIIGLVVAVIALLIVRRKYMTLLAAGVVAALAVGLAGMVMKDNILLHPFVTTVDELQSGGRGSGTWAARMDQIAVDFEEFSDHPFIGSGLVTIRLSTFKGGAKQLAEMWALSYSSNLGYTHWVKNYGLVGVLWMIAFLYQVWGMSRRGLKIKNVQDASIREFGFGYVVFVTLSLVTLGHFMNPDRLLMMCLVSAILVRLDLIAREARKKAKLEQGNAHTGLAVR